jgi:hypothetical protein
MYFPCPSSFRSLSREQVPLYPPLFRFPTYREKSKLFYSAVGVRLFSQFFACKSVVSPRFPMSWSFYLFICRDIPNITFCPFFAYLEEFEFIFLKRSKNQNFRSLPLYVVSLLFRDAGVNIITMKHPDQ